MSRLHQFWHVAAVGLSALDLILTVSSRSTLISGEAALSGFEVILQFADQPFQLLQILRHCVQTFVNQMGKKY